MNIDFLEKAKEYYQDALNDLCELLKFKSVLDEYREDSDAPFGIENKKCLEYFLSLGTKDGFNVLNVDNYAGHISYGSGSESVGVLGHLDVVPAVGKWSHEPFDPIIVDGKLFARGTLDDKGGVIASYYAMKMLRNLKLEMSKEIRIIVGCDEESGSRCVERYFSKVEKPTYAFSPDAEFPIIYGEKGILSFDILGKIENSEVLSITAGERYNIVCDEARLTVKNVNPSYLEEFIKEEGCSAEVIDNTGFYVSPATEIPSFALLTCQDSGSTLRFMLPIVGALGVNAIFHMEGRLPSRPLSPLWEEMVRMGCSLTRPTETTLQCTGKLRAGKYVIDGSVSSQFITGLLFALSLMEDPSSLTITGMVESKPYIEMTKNAMHLFGVDPEHLGCGRFISPGEITVEGDWSNGAFYLVANALGCKINVNGLNQHSCQGDRIVTDLLKKIIADKPTIDAADIPDLVPVLSVAAANFNGAVFTNIARLRLKESDRVKSICNMLHELGCRAESDENTLIVFPGKMTGGVIDACKDHRIAMSAAIAATVASGTVTILGAECAAKSYPRFWEEYTQLGGSYEQYLR